MSLPKPCAKCGETFKPNTRATRLCNSCWGKAIRKGKKK